MKIETIQTALSIIEKYAESYDPYWTGIFEVLIVLQGKGLSQEELYKSYLSDFIQKDSPERKKILQEAKRRLRIELRERYRPHSSRVQSQTVR